MTVSDRSERRRAAPPILQNAFRPFFLGAACVAGFAAFAWAGVYLDLLPARFADLDGHVHEMLYGFVAAMVCGFALTAIPNWTGRAPVSGLPLAGLFGLWLAGRAAGLVDHVLADTVDIAFLFILAGIALREILAGGNWRNLPIVLLLSAFALSHLFYHLPGWTEGSVRATFAVAAMLIAVIGGRITPSFTRNWLAARGDAGPMPVPMNRFDGVSLLLLLAALLAWLFAPLSNPTGAALLLAGLVHVLRLSRWQGLRSLSEPLVWSMHAGYAWLGLGLCLLGASIVWPASITASAGWHALAAGAVGTMGLAVMTRASLGHTGRARVAGPVTTLIYVLVHLGAVARVCAALSIDQPALLALGAVLWSAAFLIFVARYAPILFAPRPA